MRCFFFSFFFCLHPIQFLPKKKNKREEEEEEEEEVFSLQIGFRKIYGDPK